MEGQKAIKQSAGTESDRHFNSKWKAAKASCYASKAGPANGEAAQNAFKAGADQMICGHSIEIAAFDSFDSHYADEDEQ